MDELLYALKSTILDLIIDLRENVLKLTEEQEDLTLIEVSFGQLHPETAMHHVVKHVLPHKKAIEERSEVFFTTNKFIFNKLPADKVTYYENVLKDKKRTTDQHKECIWGYFDTIIAFAEEYKKYD